MKHSNVRFGIVLALSFFAPILSRSTAEAACGSYARYKTTVEAQPWVPCTVGGLPAKCCSGVPCCSPSGWSDWATICGTQVDSSSQSFSCADDSLQLDGVDTYVDLCPCDPNDANIIAQRADGTIKPSSYQCTSGTCQTSSPEPEVCDAIDNGDSSPLTTDEGCGDDEHGCSAGANDRDGAPIRFSSGRTESNPITLFDLPTPDGLFFGYRIQWNSHVMRTAAQARVVNGVQDLEPKIHHSEETTHFLGKGWLDEYSDRLVVDVRNKPTDKIVWQRLNATVTFNSASGWKSAGGKFELIDRGANPGDTFGRWVVRTTDTGSPREIWSFEEQTYVDYAATTYTLGRLRRRAILTSTLTNLTGRYGFDLTWTSSGTLDKVVDTFGRELQFVYSSTTAPNNPNIVRSRRLTTIRYRASWQANIIDIVQFRMTQDKQQLDKVDRVGTPTYSRFLYLQNPVSGCVNCGSLLTAVIAPGSGPATTPIAGAPLQLGEIALEENWYGLSLATGRYVGIRSRYPGREYAYEHNATGTTQFDLHQPGTTGCTPGSCAQGMACRSIDSTCYVADVMQHDAVSRLPISHSSSGGGSGSGAIFTRSYAPSGAPRSATDASGTRTSYGHDSSGRVRCIVRNDDDQEAFTTPAAPDSSSCAGPATSQIVQIDYNGPCTDGYTSCIKKTTTSVLSGNVIEEEDLDPATLLPVRTKRTGMTRNLAGTSVSETQTSTTAYDSYGRPIEHNGPLDDSVALDKTTITYHPSYVVDPYSLGHVARVTRYVGTSSSNTPLVTTYGVYDLNGIATYIVGPNGDYVTLSTTDNLTWTTRHHSANQTVLATSTVQLNSDGTVRKSIDPDNVCHRYEYTDDMGNYVGAPTRIKRLMAGTECDSAQPINTSTGEIEIRTYFNAEADRPQSITRKLNGATESTYTFSNSDYDRDRRLITAPTIHSTQKYALGFTDVLHTSTAAPGAPAPGAWKTSTTVDSHARPTAVLRHIDGSNTLTHGYSYASPLSPRPTQMTRGLNGASTSVTTFVYDDFGRLVETVVPEAGAPGAARATRYEYDVGSRMTKKRIGIGSALVRTDELTYDSIGRVLAVDNDTEHPVNCASAPAGTPIQDEEYKYDRCTGDVPSGFSCNNPLGRLTIARAALQCGTGGTVVKRGRWYDHDPLGRIQRVAYATVTGSTIGTPAIAGYTYTQGGRLVEHTSPLNGALGTLYNLVAGRPESVWTSEWSTIAEQIAYRAFGTLKSFNTASLPSYGEPVKYVASFGSDGSLASYRWYIPEPVWGDVEIQNQTLTRNSAGLVYLRTDFGDAVSSRYYGYDSLLRMTCEARGDWTSPVTPSSSNCTTGSTRLAGLFTYGDGASATSPPDVRTTSFVRSDTSNPTSKYVSPSVETSAYSSGSSQVQGVTRTGSSLVMGYDALGRRAYEYDSSSPTTSRREYTYLPNGQLGTVITRDRDIPTATIETSMRYDERGRPLTIASYHLSQGAQDTYELFWDGADRLMAANITFPTSRNCGSSGTCSGVRWHYHYLEGRLLAASRELVGAAQSYNIFWAVTDERGLVSRLFDPQGSTYWQVRWDASGWSSWVGTPQPEMWVPFGLPGQIVLGAVRRSTGTVWGTEAANSSGPSATARPPIALNQWRGYDPLLGAFLQPDGADADGRLMPEGYALARNNTLFYRDANGNESSDSGSLDERQNLQRRLGLLSGPYLLDKNCASGQRKLNAAIALAYITISTCAKHGCTLAISDLRKWKATLLFGLFTCPVGTFEDNDGKSLRVFGYNEHPREVYSPIFGGDAPEHGTDAFSEDGPAGLWKTYLSQSVLFVETLPCLALTIAHEAGHGWLRQHNLTYAAEEGILAREVTKCFKNTCATARLANP